MKKLVCSLLLAFLGLNLVLVSVVCKPVLGQSSPGPVADVSVHIWDVIYGRKFGTALTMDVLKPAKPNGIGVVYLLSGGWHSDFSMIEKRLKHFHYFTDRGPRTIQTVHCQIEGNGRTGAVDRA